MFSRLLRVVERRAWWVIAAWVAAAVVLTLVAPSLNDVGSQDTADYLPSDAPSQQADRILAATFPDDPAREAAIIVVSRDGGLMAPGSYQPPGVYEIAGRSLVLLQKVVPP